MFECQYLTLSHKTVVDRNTECEKDKTKKLVSADTILEELLNTKMATLHLACIRNKSILTKEGFGAGWGRRY